MITQVHIHGIYQQYSWNNNFVDVRYMPEARYDPGAGCTDWSEKLPMIEKHMIQAMTGNSWPVIRFKTREAGANGHCEVCDLHQLVDDDDCLAR